MKMAELQGVCGIVSNMGRQDLRLTNEQKAALERLGVVLLYLHGSLAAGTARADSDADIAVLFERMPEDSIKVTTGVLEALAGFLPSREKDVAILNEASPLLKQSVASRGVLLFARSSDDDLRFQMNAMHEYEYSRHVVRLGQELLLKRAV